MNLRHRAVSALTVASLLTTGIVGALAYNGSPHVLPTAAAQNDEVSPVLEGIPDTANLHVHKIIGLDRGIRSNGLAVEDRASLGEPAVGVEYTVYRVGQANGGALDLSTQQGWIEAEGIDISDFFDTTTGPVMDMETLDTTNARLAGSTPVSRTTDANGTAAFDGLSTGLYLVVEELNPYSGGGPGTGVAVAPTAPFLVTVPLSNPSPGVNGGWLETVHVYPKGQAFAAPTKRITDPTSSTNVDLTGASVGDRIGYQLSIEVPDISTSVQDVPGLAINDKLPAGLTDGAVTSITFGATTLVAGTHYQVRTWPADTDGRLVVAIRLTPAGMALYDGAGSELTVNITAEVSSVPAAGPGLVNQAWFKRISFNDEARPEGWDPEAATGAPGDPLPGTPTNQVSSTYGAITITVPGQDANGNLQNLAGAGFELRRCVSGSGELVPNSLPIAVGTIQNGAAAGRQTTWITAGEEGTVTISGIHLTNTQPGTDGTPVTTSIWADETTTEYCLVQVQAPDGYELLPAPYLLGGAFTGTETQYTPVNVEIRNVQANAGFNLPLTGGMGIWVLLGGGVILLLLAAAYYAVTRTRTQS